LWGLYGREMVESSEHTVWQEVTDANAALPEILPPEGPFHLSASALLPQCSLTIENRHGGRLKTGHITCFAHGIKISQQKLPFLSTAVVIAGQRRNRNALKTCLSC
jgi:hypothetical protein